jgi:hypothetical protein
VIEDSEDIFSASSSALLGTTSGRAIVTVRDDQVIAVAADNPAQELLSTPVDEAYQRISEVATLFREELLLIYAQHRAEARSWSAISVAAAVMGFLVVLGGLVAVTMGHLSAGMIATIVGAVSEVVAVLFFRQAALTSRQLQVDQAKLIDAERIHQAVDLVQTVDDPRLRDELKAAIVRLALQTVTNNQAPENVQE